MVARKRLGGRTETLDARHGDAKPDPNAESVENP
jgi:hypothetical protein